MIKEVHQSVDEDAVSLNEKMVYRLIIRLTIRDVTNLASFALDCVVFHLISLLPRRDTSCSHAPT